MSDLKKENGTGMTPPANSAPSGATTSTDTINTNADQGGKKKKNSIHIGSVSEAIKNHN
jgi:hypothetical protein